MDVRCRARAFLLLLALPASTASIAAESANRPWTVADSVAVRYLIKNWSIPTNVGAVREGDEPARFSPDGKHFFVGSFHGDVAEDQTVTELSIFETGKVVRAVNAGAASGANELAPVRKLAMKSGMPGWSTASAIYFPQWESAGTITFVGTEPPDRRRVYRYDIASGALTPLTEPQYSMPNAGGSGYTTHGSTILFLTYFQEERQKRTYPFQKVDQHLIRSILEPEDYTHWRYNLSHLGRSTEVVLEGRIDRPIHGPWISPDGKWAVIFCRPYDWDAPSAWSDYTFWAAGYWFMLVDLQTGASRPLVDAPPGAGRVLKIEDTSRVLNYEVAQAYWSPDSKHLLLLNTALPLDARFPERRERSYVADINVATGEVRALDVLTKGSEMAYARPAWFEAGRELLVGYYSEAKGGEPLRSQAFRYDGARWVTGSAKGRKPPAPVPRELTISIRQSANEPPRWIASTGPKELTLSEADPALSRVERASVETLHWKDSEGLSVESLLMRPREAAGGKRVPLVIQVSDTTNSPEAFLPDGLIGTGFAAQALAAQGFAVLQMEPTIGSRLNPRTHSHFQTPEEGAAQVRRVDAAVSMLKERGVIDDSPIGLVGFSRSGYHVNYVVTHPGTTRIGAAVVFDSITYGYADYVTMAASRGPGEVEHYGVQYGKNSESFWKNKQGWLDAPFFNLDRLETPVLFHITDNPVWALETLGAFQLSGRVFDYLHYPGAQHVLRAPRQRAAGMQSTIDWMAFWLQGREREAADAPGRYELWRELRVKWNAQMAAARATSAQSPETSGAMEQAR